MNHRIKHGPSFAMLEVEVGPGEALIAEAGAMVARDSHVGMEVKLNAAGKGFLSLLGSLLIAFVRKLIGGETFFVNHFTTPRAGKVWLAPHLAGQISHRRLAGETLILSSGAYLASVGAVDVKMRWGGLRGLLAKEGLFFLELTGNGDVWFNSYGGVHEEEVNGTFLVDNGHIVGFEGGLQFKIRSAGGGLLGLFASGEGLACEFVGQGKVLIQSRNLPALAGWVQPFLP